MMKNKHYKTLVERYLQGKISKEELEAFIHLTREGLLDEQLLASMDRELQSQSLPLSKKTGGRLKPTLWVAAAAMAIFAITFVLVPDNNKHQPLKIDAAAVQPARNRATLTLANGKQITLDTTKRDLSQLEDIDQTQSTNGNLVYKRAAVQTEKLAYNTISVPEGGHFHIILPDGSAVWLNAASTLTFPVAFTNRERRVKLSGEGYFEIAPDSKRPFRVETEKQLVNVLGTSFNISTYPANKLIKTSLLTGKIAIKPEANNPVILPPGKQLNFDKYTHITKIKAFDPEEIIAWKNGNFLFNETTLEEIMITIARWYAVKVNLQEVPPIRYNGFISRNVNLSKVLDMLEKTGDVKFKFENNTIRIAKQNKEPM